LTPEPPEASDGPDAVVLRVLPAWALLVIGAGLPTLLTLIRAIVVARGDFYAAMEVVRRLDVASLLGGAVLVGLSTGALPVVLAAYRLLLRRRHGPVLARRYLPDGYHYLALGSAVLVGALLTNDGYLLGAAVVVVVRLDVLARRSSPSPAGDRIGRSLAVTGLLLVPVVVLANAATAPWPTPEVIRAGDRAPVWVYVLVVEDTHTTVLYPQGGTERIPNDTPIERAICPARQINQRSRIWHPSLAQVLLRTSQPVVPALCADAPAPPVFRP
jgi:hypothetical protein